MFANLVVFVVGGAVFGCVEELGGVENVLDWSGRHHSGDHSGKHAMWACGCLPVSPFAPVFVFVFVLDTHKKVDKIP